MYEHNLMHMPVLGIYEKFCRLDVYEIESMIEAAKKRQIPTQMDLNVTFSAFGTCNFFSIMETNLSILDLVK